MHFRQKTYQFSISELTGLSGYWTESRELLHHQRTAALQAGALIGLWAPAPRLLIAAVKERDQLLTQRCLQHCRPLTATAHRPDTGSFMQIKLTDIISKPGCCIALRIRNTEQDSLIPDCGQSGNFQFSRVKLQMQPIHTFYHQYHILLQLLHSSPPTPHITILHGLNNFSLTSNLQRRRNEKICNKLLHTNFALLHIFREDAIFQIFQPTKYCTNSAMIFGKLCAVNTSDIFIIQEFCNYRLHNTFAQIR